MTIRHRDSNGKEVLLSQVRNGACVSVIVSEKTEDGSYSTVMCVRHPFYMSKTELVQWYEKAFRESYEALDEAFADYRAARSADSGYIE